MKVISVASGTTPTQVLAAGGWRSYLVVYNNSDTAMFLQFDGDAASGLASGNGLPLAASGTLSLTSSELGAVSHPGVSACHRGSASKELRVQNF